MDVKFDWDPPKAAQNLRNHGVAFTEAMTVFGDPLAKLVDDPDHSTGEDRYLLIGLSKHHRLLLVAFVERNEVVRLISARTLTRAEQEEYENT